MQSRRSHGLGRSLSSLVAASPSGADLQVCRRRPRRREPVLEDPRRTGVLPHLVAAILLTCVCGARAQDPAQPFQIQVQTNVVMVRVVVRDAQGRPVAGLHKEDFRLFDNGKPQEITGFAVETAGPKAAVAPDAAVAAAPTPAPSNPPVPAETVPQRFVALFFDDLHMDAGAVAQTRDAAWRYISTTLRPDDRVAIFTSSNTSKRGIVDFTDDRAKLHEALFRLAAHSRTNPRAGQCPSIGEYQAYFIAELQQTDALEIAAQEGYVCHCRGVNESGQCLDAERVQAQGLAGQIWGLADRQSQDALDVMDGVINLLAARPGQRTLVLVSTGFLTATREKSIEALVDRALRQNVVVNAIDAAGLYTKEYHDPILMARPDQDKQKFRMENEAKTVERDVLAALAQGTGGTFFHNSNDFDGGLRQAAQAADVAYLISFSPRDVKLDGRFHPLKVTINSGGHWDVQARRGYFANAELADKNPTKTELAQALYSLDERQDLPATVTAQVERPSGDGPNVTVKIHVDIRAAQFRKEAGRNIDTLTFDTAVFDRDGKYVAGKDSSLDFRLPDGKLEKLLQSGVNAQTSFRVPPGAYRIREVVRDTESNKMAALSYNVEVTTAPVQTAAATEPSAPGAPAAPAKPKKEKKTRSMAEWTTAEFVKAMPELAGLDPASSQDRLPILLASVGQNVKLFFETLPDTTAHERIDLDRLDWSEHQKEEFNYLDLPRPVASGVGLEEFRTNASGKRAEPLALEHGFVTKGFASMVIHFHPLYQGESEFRYLGAQAMDGRATDVVYFAQVPDKARIKQGLKTDIRSIEILIQGVAWIDPANNQIVRMRTELLTPQGDPDLKTETTESRFTAVQFKDVAQPFWLPADVTVNLNWKGMLFRNRHRYSDFQLFRVDAAPAAQPSAASGDLPGETVLLANFKHKIQQVLSQVPNYTCLEDIQRSVQKRRANAFSPLDAMLLEVSTVADKELMAWPGARRFEDVDLSSFASGGMLGSGVFASLARSVFLHDTTSIAYHGREELAGRPAARFDFRVPAESSGYQIRTNASSAKVGIAGSFWIDPASLELVRLEVRADDIPAALGIQRTATVIDYAPMRISDSDILLPQTARVLLTLPTGEVYRNDIQFSHCHAYMAESSIRFDMPDAAASQPVQPQRRVDLPADLKVSIELETAIDSATAHVGDPLRGHVARDVSRKGNTIIPKGAIATGRIRRIERTPGPGADLTVEIAELEWEDSSAQFYGELLPPASGQDGENSPLNLPSVNGGVPGGISSTGSAAKTVRSAQIPGTGVLHLMGTRFHIAAGFRMEWRTLEPNHRQKKLK